MQATELPHALAGDTLRHAAHDLPSGLYRILIPRGANLWRVGMQTYRYPEPARAAIDVTAGWP